MITEVMSMSAITLEAVGILCMFVARKGTEGGTGGVKCRLSQIMSDERQIDRKRRRNIQTKKQNAASCDSQLL